MGQPLPIWSLLPLLITLILFLAISFVLYVSYDTFTRAKQETKDKLARKHVNLSRDGARVDVRQRTDEAYVDRIQSWVYKAWTLSGEGESGRSGKGKKRA
ncbi:hypothetical protein VTJ04DRAFT_10668 [Mycothermus thermophilus]|uniref:uncharacterized protein n=1 Tax=Humicola insolens TaxID=85995 RepID=UPI003742ACCE